MTEQKSSPVTGRRRFGTSELAWLIVGALLVSISFLLVAPVLLTMNPTGIPLGVLLGLAGLAIIVVVFRSKRS